MSYKLSTIFLFYFLTLISFTNTSQADVSEDLVVTADRIHSHISKSTGEISQISNEKILASNSNSIDEILLLNSDINLVHNGPKGSSASAFLRGADSSHTLVILDGIILNDPTNPNRQFDFANLSNINIDKIEILKGSQGLLYGTNAIGGVILITSKKELRKDEKSNKLQLSLASYSTYSTIFTTHYKIGDQNLLFGLDYLTSKGFSAANDPTHPNDRDGTKNLNTDFQLNGNLSNNDSYEIKTRIQTGSSDLDKGGGPNNDDPNYLSKSQEIFSKVELNHIWNNQIQSKLYYTYVEHFRRNFDSIDSYQTYDGSNYNRGNTQSINLESTIINNDNFTHDLNLGHDQENDSTHVNSNSHVFLYNRLEFNKFIATFGGRIDYNKIFKDFYTYKIGAAKKYDLFTMHSSYSTGFQAPSLNQLFDKSHGNRNLVPEKSNSIDLGIDFSGDKVSSSTSFFYTYIKDILSYEQISLNNINAGRAIMKGIEQTFSGIINSNLNAQLFINYLNAENLSNGQRLARRPEFSVTNTITYKQDRKMINFEYKFIGKRSDVDNNGKTVQDTSYTLLNLNFEFNFNSNNSANFKIHNLLNSNYEEIWGYNTGGRICTLGYNLKF